MNTFRRALENNTEYLLDVKELLKERSERFRIRDSIFEEQIQDSFGVDNIERDKLEDALKVAHKVQKINFRRFGVDIFNDADAGRVFDEEILCSRLVESKSSKMINHPLYHIAKTDLYQVILKGFLKVKMHKQSISNQISEYLFFLMSGHSSELLVEASFDTLKYHLQSTSSRTSCNFQPWTPSIENIKSVFMNYGAAEDLWELDNTLIPVNDSSGAIGCNCPLTKFPKRNIVWVIKYIFAVLSYHKKTYTVKELDDLLIMILTVSLDKHFVQMEMHENFEISKCVKRILKTYPASEWEEDGKVSDISNRIFSKFKNVNLNDLCFLINYYISSPGVGQKLEQSLIYSIISDKVWPLEKVSHLDEVKIKDIRKIFKKDSLVKMDYYTQYYILLNLERCITNMIFTSDHLAHLQVIRPLLSNLRIKLPEVEEVVDYLLVKELITRASTMWKLSIAEVM